MRSRLSWVWWALSAAAAVWLLWMTLRPNQTVATDLASLTEPAADQGVFKNGRLEITTTL